MVISSHYDEPREEVAELLVSLRDIAGQVAQIDVRAATDDDLATRACSESLARLLEQTADRLTALQASQAADDADPLVIDLGVEPELSRPGARSPARSRVADMCFAGVLELRRVQRELAGASRTADKLAAAETARRKVRRAVRAVLETARDAGIGDVLDGEHQSHHQVADIASGLTVRRLYAQFRRSLREPTSPTVDGVLEALRYAVGALAALVASPDYADVRSSDRTVLRDLRERALRWARGARSLGAGQHLLADVRTCGDLLRGINRRQDLRAHDVALVATAVSASDGPRAAWRASLEPLFGLDDVLDDLLERTRARCDDAAAAALRARLEQLR